MNKAIVLFCEWHYTNNFLVLIKILQLWKTMITTSWVKSTLTFSQHT
jgi:hypothetical protein